jgi:hypothetical protein
LEPSSRRITIGVELAVAAAAIAALWPLGAAIVVAGAVGSAALVRLAHAQGTPGATCPAVPAEPAQDAKQEV